MTRFRDPVILSFAVWLAAWPASASAQQRPLVTEDPESIGAGRVLIEGGWESGRDQLHPASGLTGDHMRFPVLGVSVGISWVAEVQVDGGLHDRLAVRERAPAPLADLLDFPGDTTSAVEDLTIATKVRVVAEGARRPAFGLRFGTRLPLASRESGIGLGTTDFFAALLAGKTVQSVRTVGNVGVVLLEDPFVSGERDTAFTLGLSVARALTDSFEVVGEINGRAGVWGDDQPAGTESRAVIRLAGRYTYRLFRLDGGLLVGMTARDPSFGVSLGFTYVFSAFNLP